MEKKRFLALEADEWRVIINCIIEMRNKLIAEGRYTDAVDEVMFKVCNAKTKKFKVIYKEEA